MLDSLVVLTIVIFPNPSMKNEEQEINTSSILTDTKRKRAKCSEESINTLFDKFVGDKFIKLGRFYKPKNQSLNEYRHFGIKSEEGLLLSYEEVFYIFCNGQKDVDAENLDLKTKIYFDLKNSGFNILFQPPALKTDGLGLIDTNFKADVILEQKLFKKTKHFNKKSANPLRIIEYASKYDELEDLKEKEGLLAIMGDEDYCLIDVKKIESLSFEINDRLKKNKIKKIQIRKKYKT